LTQQFDEQEDDRTFNSSPRFREILDPLNSGRTDEAISKAIALIPEFPDFDMVYSWAGSGYMKKRDHDRAVAILKRGLTSAKRKYLLLSKMGSLYFDKGDISEATFYWIQAILGQRPNPDDHNPYLYLSYVASALDRTRIGSVLMSRVDAIYPGRPRLDSPTTARITSLTKQQNSKELIAAIENITTVLN
jgi:tetratricopeptide (TPR) repeat protein